MADPKKIDTGTGGFPIDDERYSYDTNPDNEAYWSSKQRWDSGDINVDKEQHDLVPAVKKTLASYLSRTTLGLTPSSPSPIRNAYPIQHDETETPRDAKITTVDGYAASPAKVSQTQPQYESSITPGDSRSKNPTNLLRGRSKPLAATQKQFSGNRLLKDLFLFESKKSAVATSKGFEPAIGSKDISKSDQTNPINEYYGNVLLNEVSNSVIYNRFNPAAPYTAFATPGVNPNYDTAQNLDDKTATLERNLYQKPRNYEFGKSAPLTVRGISYGVLTQVGPMLTMRSSAELGSFLLGAQAGAVGTIAAVTPGSAQLGLDKIKREQLTAGDVIENISKQPNARAQATNLINPAGSSWGVLNNVNDEFSGVTDVGMQLLSAALIVTISISFKSLGLIIGSGKNASGETILYKQNSFGRYFPGRYYSNSRTGSDSRNTSSTGLVSSILSGGLNFFELLGIQPTLNPYEDCLFAGLFQSFGVDINSLNSTNISNLIGSLAKSVAKTVSQSPGYYAVLARAINRSLLSIGDSFVQFGKTLVGGSVLSDPIGAIKKLFSIIDSIRNSNFLKIANTFAKMGDSALTLVAAKIRNEAFGIRRSIAASEVSTSTLKDQDISNSEMSPYTTLSWANHRAPDFLMAQNYSMSPKNRELLGMPSFQPTARSLRPSLGKDGSPEKTFYKSSIEGRIATEDRERYEDSLEAEYMPFYMQDVRTNEILSFHAFLASLNDSYSAQYDSIDAIGRVEPVKTYKSTSRKVDFSFWLVSTSPEDFDSMWLKINKLTTMAYPQFSKGRRITDPKVNYSIHAPFSQMIQAGPLVRVRIGDLIKSNYSKFNLARLFGYSYKDTMFNNKFQGNSSAEFKRAVLTEKYTKNPPTGSTWFLSEWQPQFFRDKNTANALTNIFAEGIKPRNWVLEVDKFDESRGVVLGYIKRATGVNVFENLTKPEAYYDNLFENSAVIGLNNEQVEVPVRSLMLSHELESKISKDALKESTPASLEEYEEEVRKFMSESDGNVVSRSFRSAGGKGLAGFIENLTFEWPTDKQWEVGVGEMGGRSDGRSRLGRRAPMVCKVSVSFSPIHDITPGLDHVGANRAPIYPVGPMASYDMRSVKLKQG